MLFHMLLLSYSLLALVSLPLYEFFILVDLVCFFFFFSSRRRHTRSLYDWSSDVCSSDLCGIGVSVSPCRDHGWRAVASEECFAADVHLVRYRLHCASRDQRCARHFESRSARPSDNGSKNAGQWRTGQKSLVKYRPSNPAR